MEQGTGRDGGKGVCRLYDDCRENSCISFLRKRKDDVVSIEDYHQPASCLTDDEEDADGKSPEEVLESVLAVLPPRCRDIFLMAKLQGMKYREIAESLNLSEKPSRTR